VAAVTIRKFLKAHGVPKRERQRIERAVKQALAEMGFPVLKSASADQALRAARRQMSADTGARLAAMQARADAIAAQIRQLGGGGPSPNHPAAQGAALVRETEDYLRAWAVTRSG
jgi:hypothetical protein